MSIDRLIVAGRWFGEGLVKSVSLNGFSSGFEDGFAHGVFGLTLGGACSSHVENVFLDDGSMQIVRTVAQCHLCHLESHAHPVSGDMIEIVQKQPGYGNRSQHVVAGGRSIDRDFIVLGLIRQRDKTTETACFVLEFPQLPHVIYAVFQ